MQGQRDAPTTSKITFKRASNVQARTIVNNIAVRVSMLLEFCPEDILFRRENRI